MMAERLRGTAGGGVAGYVGFIGGGGGGPQRPRARGVLWAAGGARPAGWAVARAILRSEVPARLYRFALAPALVATGAMALMLVAAVVWGVALRASDPTLFGGNDGIHSTSTALSWGVQVAVMALCTLAAL